MLTSRYEANGASTKVSARSTAQVDNSIMVDGSRGLEDEWTATRLIVSTGIVEGSTLIVGCVSRNQTIAQRPRIQCPKERS